MKTETESGKKWYVRVAHKKYFSKPRLLRLDVHSLKKKNIAF